uniref:(northern house mosquito) hypothetical protein n=1 Tax=Culex pipiens TaxID=7175 RepID=A0A8D8DBC5_CULPI
MILCQSHSFILLSKLQCFEQLSDAIHIIIVLYLLLNNSNLCCLNDKTIKNKKVHDYELKWHTFKQYLSSQSNARNLLYNNVCAGRIRFHCSDGSNTKPNVSISKKTI